MKALLAGVALATFLAVSAPAIAADDLSASARLAMPGPSHALLEPLIGTWNVEMRVYPGPGAVVEEVTPGSPAQRAGLLPGDVITEVDGRPVADAQTLIIAIRANAPGDEITLTVLRGTEQFTAEVTLQARSDVP